jgi:purine-binding chemotaxis protein CheW
MHRALTFAARGHLMAFTPPQQVLTFDVGSETYGIDIMRIREIRGWSAASRIPKMPAHVLGVLNLRGEVIPVVDLRMRFGLQSVEYTATNVIVVLMVMYSGVQRVFGFVVDAVSDVLDVDAAQLREAPEFGGAAATQYIAGLLPASQRLVILLNIDSLIAFEPAS